MVQFVNEFIEYCSIIGILEKDQNFEQIHDDLGQMLFMHLVTLNRQSLIELSNRISQIWLMNQNITKPIVTSNSAKQFTTRSKHSQSTPQESKSMQSSNNQSTCYLYDQYINKEEKKIEQSQKVIENQLKECTFKPQISKKSHQLDTMAPVYERLSKFGNDQRMKYQISMDIKTKSELKQCTFRPQVNHNSSLKTLESDPFSRLYQNALSQRQSKPIIQEKIYPFKPQLISQPIEQQEYLSIPVEDRLYNHFFDQQQQLVLLQQNESQAQLDDCTFIPNINQYTSHQQGSEQKIKVFERLYNKSSAIKSASGIKEQNLNQFSISKQSDKIIKNANSDHSKYVSQFQIEQSPFDRLHSEHKRIEKKKKVKENQIFNTLPFKPQINNKK
ncbi:unnamed protein product [Paramecium sonneborni]|uniref:Uncharacterized protein n=1 Tax=Paramecium sonneborni TaxID=65129 RepID=A0A8S1QUT2_9CILI|nr:unnamed protein product [Paramecium sonneborni]